MSQRGNPDTPGDDHGTGLGVLSTPEQRTNEGRKFRVGDVKDTLKLYAALALLLEGGLGALVILAPTETVQLSAVIGMILVFGLMVVIAGRNWESTQGDPGDLEERFLEMAAAIDPLWGEEHRPLHTDQVSTLLGAWRCEWTARNSEGDLQPYVDDTVKVEAVNGDTGELEASGTETYEKNPEGYKLRGRASKQGLANLYYRYPTAIHREKVGMVILRIDFVNEIAEGWWLGGGRGLGSPDVGGLVKWTKADRYDGDWVDRAYDFEAA